MFRKVLFATDLSTISDRALACMAQWRATGLEEVVLLHVHPYQTGVAVERELRREDEPRLERQAGLLRDAGLRPRWRFSLGVPYLEIDRLAGEEGVDAVVIGSHGASFVREVWMGSVADAVLRSSRWPVIILKAVRLATLDAETCREFCGALSTRLLYATDFSDGAEAALAVLGDRVMSPGAAVHLIHVQEKSRLLPHLEHRLEEFDRIDHERLARIGRALEAAGAGKVTQEVVLGHPVRGILGAAESFGAHLVVVGSRGRGHLEEALLGGTAHKVATLSPVPVLVVPEPRE